MTDQTAAAAGLWPPGSQLRNRVAEPGGIAGHPFELAVALAAVRPHAEQLVPVRFRRDHLPVC